MPRKLSPGLCSVEGCDRPRTRKEMCDSHYRRMLAHGDPLAGRPLRPYKPNGQVCQVEGCDDRPHAKRFCLKHYLRWKKYGDPLIGRDFVPKEGGECLVDGCTDPKHTAKWCQRHAWIWYRYRLDPEDHQRMWLAQGGRCPICLDAVELVVDHDHATGAVRGLLCSPCNQGIGFLRDEADNFRRAIEYLEVAVGVPAEVAC